MLAIVADSADAVTAADAGADRIVFAMGSADRRQVDELRARLRAPLSLLDRDEAVDPDALLRCLAQSGSDEVRLPLAETAAVSGAVAAGVAVVGVVPVERAGEAGLAAQASGRGLRGLMVAGSATDGPRLLEAVTMPALAALVADCRASGLTIGLSGLLELPDVPRLLALDPDELGFDVALRAGLRPEGSVDPAQVRAVCDLMGRSGPRGVPDTTSGEPDRIFVRDWVLPIGIGAYAHERHAPQRVRFSVEAEIARQASKAADLRDVVSYDLITDAIRRLVAGHVDLVETLAEQIAEAVLTHPRILAVAVTVEKLELGPGAVGCRIRRIRAEP